MYRALRAYITPPGKASVQRKLACGALAGSISQTLTYPFEYASCFGFILSGRFRLTAHFDSVLRRKMQVRGLNALGLEYNGALDALATIVRKEGIRGLYRGLWPNLREFRPCLAFSLLRC